MTNVKICGLSQLEHAMAAAEAGADYIGFVFAESRRKANPGIVAEIVRTLRQLKARPETVGVFANSSIAEVREIVTYCGLDRVQLSGSETLDYCRQLDMPVTLTLHVASDAAVDGVLGSLDRLVKESRGHNTIFLLDTKVGNLAGGTGERFDWSFALAAAARFPIMVAGGLDPDNVGKLIAMAHPWGVDVSSGVETDGKKSAAKIHAFVKATKETGPASVLGNGDST